MSACTEDLVDEFNDIFEQLESEDPVGFRTWIDGKKRCNKAVRLFSESVVQNRERLREPRDFERLIQAYINIMMYADLKPNMRPVLSGFVWLDGHTKDEIIAHALPGLYVGLTKPMKAIADRVAPFGKEFLDLIEGFVASDNEDRLWGMLRELVVEKMGIGGPAVMTGMFSALWPERFMVYNKISALPLGYTPCSKFVPPRMKWWHGFNEVYAELARQTRRDLMSLDIAAYYFGRRMAEAPSDSA